MTDKQTIENMEMQLIEEECSIDLTKKLDLPPVAMSYGEYDEVSRNGTRTLPVPLGTYGNFSFIQAPPKTMKTYLISLITSVYLSKSGKNTYGGRLRSHRGDKCLIHFDTEQGEYHAQRVFNRVVDMNKDDDVGCYHTFALRSISHNKRVEFIEYYLKKVSAEKEIGLVIIDGLADLVGDVNSLDESNRCAQKLMEWSARYKCHIITVIHTNFGTSKATGHLGSVIAKKCETSIHLEKSSADSNLINVKCNMSRGMPFETFAFKINKIGYPEIHEFEFDILGNLGINRQKNV